VNGVAAWLLFGAPFCVVFYGAGRPNCYVPRQHVPSIIQATVLVVLDLSSLLCLITGNGDLDCRNPTLAKCEDETHIPKVGNLESSGTPECLEFDNRGQNTSDWGVLGVIEKVLKTKCSKWPRIGHLDICSPSYGQKKG